MNPCLHSLFSRRFVRVVLASVVCCLLAMTVSAQSDEETRDKAPTGKETIVVVGQDHPETLKNESRAVIVIDPAAAQASGLLTVADAIRWYAPINIVTTGVMPGSLTSSFIRGGESSYTLMLLDDLEINRVGGFFDLGNLSLDNIERIEILEGPGSTLYGSEAVSGTIRIYTKKGQKDTRLRVYGQGGSFTTFSEGLEFSGGIGSKVRLAASFSRVDSDRQRPINDDYHRNSASLSLGGDSQGKSTWSVRYRFNQSKTNFPTGDAGDLFDVLDPHQYTDTLEHAVTLEWSRRWGDAWETRFSAGYFRLDQDYVDNDDGPEVDPWGEFQSNLIDTRWRVDIRGSRIWKNHRLTLGGTITREQSESSDLFTPESITYKRFTEAIYLNDTMQVLGDKLNLSLGIRYEKPEDYADVLSPQVSLSYWVIPELKVRGSVGFGFKAPAFYQIHGFPGFAAGNPDLKPEQNVGWDAGLEYWGEKDYPMIRANYFENRFKDIIEFVFDPTPGVPNYFNLQAARARGVELALAYRWSSFSFRGEYTYTDTKTTDAGMVVFPGDAFLEGEPLLRRPKHRAVLSAGYEGKNYSAWIDVLYQGSRWDLDFSKGFIPQRVQLEDYTRLDIRARAHLWREVYLTGRVENLLNTKYQEVFGYRGGKLGVYLGFDMTF